MTDLDSALPSLRGHAPLNLTVSQSTPPSASSPGYRPALSPLNESGLNSPEQSPTKSASPSKRVSSFALTNWGISRSQAVERATLFDQPPVNDSFEIGTSLIEDSIIEDKENRSV